MVLSTRLFRIAISNNYYKKSTPNINNDFEIESTSSTASWMYSRKIQMLRHVDGIELVWLSQHYDHPLELLKSKIEGVSLFFKILLKNNQIVNLSELDPGYPTGQVYYLHNRHHNDNYLLHSKDFMGMSDLINRQEIEPYLGSCQEELFAMIYIDLPYWWEQAIKQKSSLFSNFITYHIKIQNRSTFWRYYVVDTQKCLNGMLHIASQGEDSFFGALQPSLEAPHVHYAVSAIPLELSDQYDHFFSLYKRPKANKGNHTVLLEKLPYPKPDSLKKDKIDKKKFYSDIVVYV